MTRIYWDTSDPDSHGWAWRTDAESGPIDGAAARALDDIIAGHEPAPQDLDILHDDYPDGVLYDGGHLIGALWPEDD